MADFLTHAPATHETIAALDLEVALGAYQDDALTGMIEVTGGLGAPILLLFVEGMLIEACVRSGAAWRRVSPDRVQGALPAATLTLRRVPLPAEGVRIVKMLLDWQPPVEEAQVEGPAVVERLNAWGAQATASVIHIRWADAEGLVALLGGGRPPEALFAAAGQVVGGDAGQEAVRAGRAGPCTLTRCAPPAGMAAAQEGAFAMRAAFAALVDGIVPRYAELVGRGLAEALARDLEGRAGASGLPISVTDAGVTGVQVMNGPEAAASVYRPLINGMVEHMTVVVGKRLAQTILVEAADRLNPDLQRAAQAGAFVP